MEKAMQGAELQSMLKSSVNFKSNGGVVCEELTLNDEQKKWWQDAKIGMFFHWGLYSILGRGEWTMFNEKIPYGEYRKLADEFNPQNFSMSELTGLAKDLGAKYTVMVTRHHDGFALWNSRGSWEGYTSVNTASKRDFVKEYTEACRADGLRVGLYYSPMDWRFPGYFDPKGLPENAALLKKQGYSQVEELCRDYGKIDILWYDGGWLSHKGTDADAAWFWEPVKLNKMVRSYNPDILINPRSGLKGDFECDEGGHEIKGEIVPVPWEKCMSISGSWAWRSNDEVWKTDELIKMIVDVICRGGNILLNVAPDRNGKIDERVIRTVCETGNWLKQHSDSIYGTRAGVFHPIDNVFGSTYKDNKIYLHIWNISDFRRVILPPIGAKIISCATYDGIECAFSQDEAGIRVVVPDTPNQRDTVLCLQCDRNISSITPIEQK